MKIQHIIGARRKRQPCDDDGKLLGEAVTEKDKTSLTTYTYDKVGNRLTKVEGGKTTLK